MTSIGSSNKRLNRYERQASPGWGPNRVKRLLTKISPKDLAERLEVDVTTIYRWANGYTRPARRFSRALREIEQELGCDE